MTERFAAFVGNVDPAVRRALLALKRLIDAIRADMLIVVNAQYNPTLTGMVPGTGGSNNAEYTWVGGPNAGDKGTLSASGVITFGTSGQTFPTAPTIALPSGFNLNSTVTTRPIGKWRFVDANAGANDRYLDLAPSSASAVRPMLGGESSNPATLTTTTPVTWQSSDRIEWIFTSQAVRV